MAQSKKNGKTNRTGRTAKQKRMPRYEADSLAACLMVGILLLATGILTLLGAGFGLQHEVFRYLRQFSSSMFGSMTLLMTFALIAAGVALLISTTRKVSRRYVASYAILVVLLSGFVSLMTFVTSSEGQFPLLDYIAQKTGSDAFSGMMSRSMTYGMKGYGGGMVGMLLAWPLWKFFGAGLGAVILGLLMAVDVLVGGWSLFRRLYGWTGEKLVQLREKQAKRAEEAAAEEARRQEQERQRQLAEEQERIRQGNAANAAYTQNTPSPYARPGTEKGRVVSPYTQYPNAPVQPVMPQNPPVRKQPMPQGKPVQPVTSRKNNKIGFAPSAEELGQTGFADDWTTPRRKSAWSDSQPFTQPTYPMGQAAAEPPQIPTYEQPKQPAPSGVGEPATYSWNDMPAQPAPMQQTADAVPETEQNPPMMQWTQPTMPTQPTMAVDAPQETQEEILPEAPEETPADLPEAVSARLHQRRQRHAHHLAQRAHVIIGDPLPETALPLVEQRRTVEHAGDGLDGLEIGAPVVQPPDDARVDLRSAERHDYGHPLAKRHAFRHRKGVERLGQRKYDVGIAHGRSRIEKECFQAAEPTGPSGAEPQPQNDGINSVFLRVKLRIIPGKQILPAGSTRSIISNRRRFPNSSSYR